MKKCLVLIAVALFVFSIPVMAGKVTQVPVQHPVVDLYQAYLAASPEGALTFDGYNGFGGDSTVTAVPGVLAFDPGGPAYAPNWSNFIDPAAQSYVVTVKNVLLTKTPGKTDECSNPPLFTIPPFTQQGTVNIRTWWPLMYELPGTQWQLSILYGTRAPFLDSANTTAQNAHTEIWTFQVDANLESMMAEVALFHELPFGQDEVGLIFDEDLYYGGYLNTTGSADTNKVALLSLLQSASDYLDAGDTVNGGLALMQFEMEVSDACVFSSPLKPRPRPLLGSYDGIANSFENPACCKLLADSEYVGFATGLFQNGVIAIAN
jgi:hypothetical protein